LKTFYGNSDGHPPKKRVEKETKKGERSEAKGWTLGKKIAALKAKVNSSDRQLAETADSCSCLPEQDKDARPLGSVSTCWAVLNRNNNKPISELCQPDSRFQSDLSHKEPVSVMIQLRPDKIKHSAEDGIWVETNNWCDIAKTNCFVLNYRRQIWVNKSLIILDYKRKIHSINFYHSWPDKKFEVRIVIKTLMQFAIALRQFKFLLAGRYQVFLLGSHWPCKVKEYLPRLGKNKKRGQSLNLKKTNKWWMQQGELSGSNEADSSCPSVSW